LRIVMVAMFVALIPVAFIALHVASRELGIEVFNTRVDLPALAIASIVAGTVLLALASLDIEVGNGGMVSLLAGLGTYTMLKEMFKHKLQQR